MDLGTEGQAATPGDASALLGAANEAAKIEAGSAPAGPDGGPARPAPGTGSEVTGAADPEWYGQLAADGGAENEPSLRDWVKSAGVKDLNGLAKIARDNQRALRDSGRVKVPGEGASEAEMAAYRKAIGVPEDVKGYALPAVKGEDGNPVNLNTARLEQIAALAHQHGIPKAALDATLQALAEADAMEFATGEAEIQRRADAHAAKWGTKRAENVANITAAARHLGLSRDELLAMRAALGPERALDVFADLGSRIGEDTMVEGGSRTRFGVSGAEAQKVLDAKMKDKTWADKALVPGSAERAEYERLNNAIAAAADRQQREDA